MRIDLETEFSSKFSEIDSATFSSPLSPVRVAVVESSAAIDELFHNFLNGDARHLNLVKEHCESIKACQLGRRGYSCI